MIKTSMKIGLQRGWQLKKILAIFWLGNLLIALLFLRPYTQSFYRFFKHRMITDELVRQNLYPYFAEFYHYMKPAVEAAKLTLNLGSLVYFLLSILLSGGLVFYLLNRDEVKMRTFWSKCGHFLGRMIRLVIVSIFLFFTAVLFSGLIFALIFWILPDNSPENQLFWGAMVGTVFAAFFFILFLILLDLTKVFIVRDDASSVISSLWKSLRLFKKQFGKIFLTYLLFYLISLGIFLISFWLHSYVPGTSGVQIGIAFTMTQIYLILQYWLKFARLGALGVFASSS